MSLQFLPDSSFNPFEVSIPLEVEDINIDIVVGTVITIEISRISSQEVAASFVVGSYHINFQISSFEVAYHTAFHKDFSEEACS